MPSTLMIWCGGKTVSQRPSATSISRLASGYASSEYLHALSSNDVTREMETPMTEAVLPRLSTDDTTAQLPSDPKQLLSAAERQELAEGLARLAELRRDAETASASLRLA